MGSIMATGAQPAFCLLWPLGPNQHSVYYGYWGPTSILSTMATGAQPEFCLLWPLVPNQNSVYYGYWCPTSILSIIDTGAQPAVCIYDHLTRCELQEKSMYSRIHKLTVFALW